MNARLLKGFAGAARFGSKLLIFSLVSVLFLFIFSTIAADISISSGSAATSLGTGVVTVGGDQISKNDTQELYNFTLVIAYNVSNITIIVPRTITAATSANISVLNTTVIQLGTNLTGWIVTYVENFSKSGDPLRIQINTSTLTSMLGVDNATSNTVWFAFNATPKISGATPSDNHTMTWEVYIGNETSFSAATKLTTLVDNSVPNIFNIVPKLNASRQTYLKGTTTDVFQVNVSDTNLNISNRANNDGSTNVTLWIRKGSSGGLLAKTALCYNSTGGFKANGPTDSLYTCNVTVDLSTSGDLQTALQEGDTVQFFFNASDTVLNTGFNGTTDSPIIAMIDRTAPTSSSVQSNVSYAKNTSYVTLSATFADNYELGNATLETNETGAWVSQVTNTTSIGMLSNSSGSPWDMGIATTYSVNFTWRNQSVLSGTIVAWRINATDEAGNTYATAAQTFVVDSTLPAATIVSHTARQNVSGIITVNASVNDSLAGISMVFLNVSNYTTPAIGGIKVMSIGVPGYYSATYDTTIAGLIDGNYSLIVFANDTIDNALNSTKNVTIQVDNNAPVISVTRPTENQYVKGPFNITANINDIIWVSYVQYKISNASSSLVPVFLPMTNASGMNNTNGGVYNATNVTSVAIFGDGVYNVTIWANDSVNNIAQTNVSIFIDNNAPAQIGLNTTEPNSNSMGYKYFRFNLTAADNTGVAEVLLQFTDKYGVGANKTAFRYFGTAYNGYWSTNVSELAANTSGYEMKWFISDSAGNYLVTDTWYYQVAKNNSAYALVSVNASVVERGDSVNISSVAMSLSTLNPEANASIYANVTGGYALDTLSMKRLASGGNFNITNTSNLPVGTYYVAANITASENYTDNATLQTTYFTVVDTTGPFVVFLNNSADEFSNGTIVKTGSTITMNVSAYDNVFGWGLPAPLVVNVYLNVTNGSQVLVGTLTNASLVVGAAGQPNFASGVLTIPAGLSDGNLTFNFTVADIRGNIGVNRSVSNNYVVTVDNTAPAFSASVPTNNSFIGGTATELFQVSVVEANLNISKNVTLYWGFTTTTSNTKSKTMLCSASSGSSPYQFAGPNWICNTTIDLHLMANGDSVYYFFNTSNATHPAGDLAGNTGSFGNVVIPFNTTTDRAYPTWSSVSPLGNANISGSFAINISAINTVAGVSVVAYRITNATFASPFISLTRTLGTTYSGYWSGTNATAVPGLADGTYWLNINATSTAGLSNSTFNITIILDSTKPNVTITRPTTLLNFSTSIIINATVRDSGVSDAVVAGSIVSVQYRLSNSSWAGSLLTMTNTSTSELTFDYYNATNDTSANFADGIYNITVIATDYAGNFNATNVTIGIDRTAPAVSIKGPTANQYIKGVFNITAEVNDGLWVKRAWYRISNGTHALDIRGSDYLKMTNASGVNATGGGYFNATNITDAVVFGDGLYNITVAANDTLNRVTYANVTVTIDNNAPAQFDATTNTSEPASGTEYIPGRFYRFNKTFNDTMGTVSVILQLNATNHTAFRYEGDATGGNWSANVTDLAANASGYPVIWYASDAAGNWLTTTAWRYVVAKNTTAAITVLANVTTWERGTALNLTAYSNASVSINATIYANISSPPFATFENLTAMYYVPFPRFNQNITVANQNMVLGSYNVTANATATENYTAIAGTTITITLQDTFPIIVAYSPLNNTNASGTMLINASAIDASGVSVVVYNITNSTNATVLTGTMSNIGNINTNFYSASVSTLLISEGTYNLWVQANDTANNLNNSYMFNITIDNTAPSIWFNHNGTAYVYGYTPINATYKRGIVAINFTATDSFTNISTNGVSVRIGNATHWMGPAAYITESDNAIFNFTNQTNVMASGLYNFTVTANDTAGNAVTNVTWVYVDNTAPSVYANTTGNVRKDNTSQDIRVTMIDAQTNASMNLMYRFKSHATDSGWKNLTLTGAVGSAANYSTTFSTLGLPVGQIVEYYIIGTDNATNAISNINNNYTNPFGTFTITDCGSLSWCSARKSANYTWTTFDDMPAGMLATYTSLGGNYTIPKVFASLNFTFVYHHNGSQWISYNSQLALTQNTLINVSTTDTPVYHINMTRTGSIDIA